MPLSGQRNTTQQGASSLDLPLYQQRLGLSEGTAEPPSVSSDRPSTAAGSPEERPASTRGRHSLRGSSSGRGATRGGTYTNVFATRTSKKQKPTLIEQAADPTKGQKLFTNWHIRRKAQLAGREVAERPPDLSAIGGLFDPSNPIPLQHLRPGTLRKTPASNAISQDSDYEWPSMETGDAHDTDARRNRTDEMSPPTNNALNRPIYSRERHGNRAICYFWYHSVCRIGIHGCSFVHGDDAELPIAPPPPNFKPDENRRAPQDPSSELTAASTDSVKAPWKTRDTLPQEPLTLTCFFWHRNGNCSRGEHCKFFHGNDPSVPIAPPPPGFDKVDTDRRENEDRECQPLLQGHSEIDDVERRKQEDREYERQLEEERVRRDAELKEQEERERERQVKEAEARKSRRVDPPSRPVGEHYSGTPFQRDPAIGRPPYNPQNPYHSICWFWHQNGDCIKGDSCDYVHGDYSYLPIAPQPGQRLSTQNHLERKTSSEEPDSRPPYNEWEPDNAICYWWYNFRNCTKANCRLFHEELPNVALEPGDKKRIICRFWLLNDCHAGATCLFKHADPPSEPIISVPVGAPTGPRKSVKFEDYEQEPASEERSSDKRKGHSLKNKPICRHWLRNDCRHGELCWDRHSLDSERPDERIPQLHTQNPNKIELPPANQRIQQIAEQAINRTDSSRRVQFQDTIESRIIAGDSSTIEPVPSSTEQKTKPKRRVQFQDVVESEDTDDFGLPVDVQSPFTSVSAGEITTKETAEQIQVGDKPTPTMKMKKIKMGDYKIQKLKKAYEVLGAGRAKEVLFGVDDTRSVILDFGDIGRGANEGWGQSFLNLHRIYFRQMCTAQDFCAQQSALQSYVFWHGPVSPNPDDRESSTTMDKVAEQLKLCSGGLISVCDNFIVLIYPVIQEWKFVGTAPNFTMADNLRFAVFQTNLDIGKPLIHKEAEPTLYRKTLTKRLHGLRYSKLVPKSKNKEPIYHFYLLFPASANSTAEFLASWLRSSDARCKVYSSQTEGSWDFFAKSTSIEIGIVLVHELAVALISDLPSLFSAIYKSYSFWCINDSSSKYTAFPALESPSLGQISVCRILPHGHVFLLTPSFLVADPENAFLFLKWFHDRVKRMKSQGNNGTWKIVCAHNVNDYLLDLALEKSQERDSFEEEHRNVPAREHMASKRGLSYQTCEARFKCHSEISEMLFGLTSDFSDVYDSDVQNDIDCPIVYAHESIDPDDEQALVTWFAGWSLTKLDQFRKYTVIGTNTKNVATAYRFKEITLNDVPGRGEPLKPLSISESPTTPEKHEHVSAEPPVSAEKLKALNIAAKFNLSAPTMPSATSKPRNSMDHPNAASPTVPNPPSASKSTPQSIGTIGSDEMSFSSSSPAKPISTSQKPLLPRLSKAHNPWLDGAKDQAEESREENVLRIRGLASSPPSLSLPVGNLGSHVVSRTDPDVHQSSPITSRPWHGIDHETFPEALAFISITGSNLQTAKDFLSRSSNNVQLAVEQYNTENSNDRMEVDAQVLSMISDPRLGEQRQLPRLSMATSDAARATDMYSSPSLGPPPLTSPALREVTNHFSPRIENPNPFSPTPFDGAGDERPQSSDSNMSMGNGFSRSGTVADEYENRIVPRSMRQDGSMRKEKAGGLGFVPTEDKEVYRNRRVVTGLPQSGSSEKNFTSPSAASPSVHTSNEDKMDADPPFFFDPPLEEPQHATSSSSKTRTAKTEDGNAKAEKGKKVRQEVRYEATTAWYERLKSEGGGWAHLYVEGWEKCSKYLGYKQ